MVKKKSYLTVTDMFCGAGGSSQGVRIASARLNIGNGIHVAQAHNHWKLAIETHATNFTETDHHCTDIQASDPRWYAASDILIASPECTNHTLAKGKKIHRAQIELFNSGKVDPKAERSRATMWDVPRFAEVHKYNIIIVENVVDAYQWILFEPWLATMHKLGYDHKCVFLNSMHCWPTPQSRDRMYVVFWRKGNKAPDLEYMPPANCGKCEKDILSVQAWKNGRRAGKYRTQYVYCCPTCSTIVEPYYYAAFNAIDWSIKGIRIGDREALGKKPLALNTEKRIRSGLEVHGGDPLIITTKYTSGIECRVKNATGDVIPTQPGEMSHAICHHPYIIDLSHSHSKASRSYDSANALPTQTTGQTGAMVVPPPFLVSHSHTMAGEKKHYDLRNSAMTQTTKNNSGILIPPVPFIVTKPYGHGEQLRSSSIKGVFPTQPTDNRHSLITVPAFIDEHSSSNTAGRSIADPLSTVLAGGNHHGLAYIVENKGQSTSRPITEALSTNTTKVHHGLITDKAFSAFISNYYGGSIVNNPITDAMGACTTIDGKALVTYEKPKYEDCEYRMLKASEVIRAMAFDEDYIVLGNQEEQVKQAGNAVTPPAMAWLIEQCVKSLM